MKTVTVVLVVTVFVVHISGYLIQVPTTPIVLPSERAPIQWLREQKLMLPLFENVCEISSDSVIRKLSLEFKLTSEDYLDPEVITNLQGLMATGLLPKGEIFSEYNPEHMKELKIIYDVLYSAKDFDAFYKAAAWARQNLNCGLYVNAIYMTIQARRDTQKLSIPAPYELLPNYFIRKDVIVQASTILAGQEITPTEGVRDEGNAYYLDANYTAMFYNNNDDSKLAYFREDIGLNSYYFLRKLRMSPWFNDDINSSYGETMYQMMKQFMARYNLERYANGLPEIDGIDWNSLPDIPYDPELIYSDGYKFIHRSAPLEFTAVNEDLTLLQTIENNVDTVVDHMLQRGYNKTQILNHLMEILVTGDRSYETLARQLLGKDHTNNGHVSVLEHYMTSLRDPMFWKIYKNIVDIVDSALKTLPTYTRTELYFPGVEVVNIDVKKMMTAYDYFEFDVTNALKIDDSNTTFNIKIGQPRLNHKPFTIKVNISSLVTKKGLLKIYLGPKLMPGEIASKKNLFTLLDMFEVNLRVGTNIITRTSNDMKHFSPDFVSLKTIQKKVEDAEFGLDSLPQELINSQIGYPSRLILPKGSPQGLPLQMFVFVAPFVKASLSESYSTNSMEFNTVILSPGYPLDLMIEDRQLFALPNALIKYVTVTHKGDSKVENYGGSGVTKQWYGTNSYDPSAQPNYSSTNRKSFDYTADRGSYVNKENYSPKVNEYNVAFKDTISNEENSDYDIAAMPQLLKSAKTYLSPNTEKKGSYLNKEQEVQYGKTDYLTNRIDYSKYPLHKDLINKKENQNIIIDTPHLLKSSKFDYASKYKSEKAYKKEKEQVDKKDYTSKDEDYYKYLIVIPSEKDKVYNEKKLDNPFIDTSRLVNSFEDSEKFNYKVDNAKIDQQYISSDVVDYHISNLDSKIFNTPHLLKSSYFDNFSKSKDGEPFDYKSKKAQFDKKDYSAKKGDYTKYHTVTPAAEEATMESINTDPINNFDVGNQEEAMFPRQLKSTNFDYSAKSKRKEPFDYKAKKAQFDKKDYSGNREDYTKYRTATPREEEVTTSQPADNLARVVLNKDINNLDLVNEINENNMNDIENVDIPYDDDITNSNVKRTPTVYDFLFHTIDFEVSPENKVYE